MGQVKGFHIEVKVECELCLDDAIFPTIQRAQTWAKRHKCEEA